MGNKPRKWLLAALFNFFIAGVIGVILRMVFVVELPIEYFHFRHAHSHLAMLGWVFLGIYTLIVHSFLPRRLKNEKRYTNMFWGLELSAVGTFLSFIFQGYGAFSLGFFLFHILLSYFSIYFLWLDTKGLRTPSIRLLRTSLIWLFLSSMGIWAICILIPLGLGNSSWYHMAVQFFLHFQLGGWFTFAILALFFKYGEDKGLHIPTRWFRTFYWLLNIATILTYALAIAWVSSHPLSYFANGIGVLTQLAALIALLAILYRNTADELKNTSKLVRALFLLSFISFVLRILIQSSLVFPKVAEMAHTIQNLVIGFIHLNVLGFITFFILGASFWQDLLDTNKVRTAGVGILTMGVFLTEILLFLQGLFFWLEIGFLPFYHHFLFFFSLLLPVGVLLMMIPSSGSGSKISPEY